MRIPAYPDRPKDQENLKKMKNEQLDEPLLYPLFDREDLKALF
jgi:hypothetical protein